MADEIGIHDDGVLTAVRGTIFMAKAETIITSALLKQFTVEAATVGVGDGMWTNLGHMSNDNLPEFALDGGDATTLSTWLKVAFRTQYAQTTGTVTFNSVQGDKGTFKTFYNAVDMTGAGVAFSLEKTPINKSLFILWSEPDATGGAGLLLPNSDIAFSSLPALSTDSFVEFSAQANIKTSSSLPHDKNGKFTSVAYFAPSDFTV
ncbi:hypothetical protein GBD05_09950 [Bifidobacterium longum]|nr:hypothetical protein GBD05_09950 [Bifidobacterium longum]